MSSSELRPTRRRIAALLAVLAVSATAGGCLRPLYAESTISTIGGSVRSALRDIEIAEIKGLSGHYLRNELAFELDGGGENTAAKRLNFDATLRQSLEVVTVDYANGRADSAVLVLAADWTLTRRGSGELVSSGSNIARAPYERTTQRFATVRAARDAQIRAAKTLATVIRGQIAADLTGD